MHEPEKQVKLSKQRKWKSIFINYQLRTSAVIVATFCDIEEIVYFLSVRVTSRFMMRSNLKWVARDLVIKQLWKWTTTNAPTTIRWANILISSKVRSQSRVESTNRMSGRNLLMELKQRLWKNKNWNLNYFSVANFARSGFGSNGQIPRFSPASAPAQLFTPCLLNSERVSVIIMACNLLLFSLKYDRDCEITAAA